jgi:hypothetical protein
MYNNKWDQAIDAFKVYINTAEGKVIKDFIPAERMLEMSKNGKIAFARPVECKFTNMGKAINTPFEEYNPFITADGRTLLFTSRRKGNMGGFIEDLGIFTADIFTAFWKDTAWGKARSIGANVNTSWDEETTGITATGDQMYLYYDNEEAFEDIALATLKGKMWQKPELLPEPFNSKEYEGSSCISLDGLTRIFSSERKDGIGGNDLWMSKKEKNGDWTIPVNLGSSINTNYDEDHPYLSLDGRRLYFCSKGWNSMGGFDIFYSTWNENGQRWEKPVNIGYPVNDADDNTVITFKGDQRFAYISSVRPEGYGDKDIYLVEFLDTTVHGFNHYISGSIANMTSRIEMTKVTLENKASGSVTVFQPVTMINQFIIPAKAGSYTLKIEGYNFAPYTEDLVIEDVFPPVEIRKTIQLQQANK